MRVLQGTRLQRSATGFLMPWEISILPSYPFVKNIIRVFKFEMPYIYFYPFMWNINPIILSLYQKYQSYHPILMSEISILLSYPYDININPIFMYEMPVLSSYPYVRNIEPTILLLSEISILPSYSYVRNINPISLSLCQKYQSYHSILMSEISMPFPFPLILFPVYSLHKQSILGILIIKI